MKNANLVIVWAGFIIKQASGSQVLFYIINNSKFNAFHPSHLSGDRIFSTWKNHTIFSTSFFWFWNVPILSGDLGIFKKYLKVEKLVF